MIRNMVEAGIGEAAAQDITHNAFVDGYEESQKIIMKEAFDTFMTKSYDDFVKVADFTEKYIIKEAEFAPVEGEDREKVASLKSIPLRGSKADTDRSAMYREYWEQKERERRGF